MNLPKVLQQLSWLRYLFRRCRKVYEHLARKSCAPVISISRLWLFWDHRLVAGGLPLRIQSAAITKALIPLACRNTKGLCQRFEGVRSDRSRIAFSLFFKGPNRLYRFGQKLLTVITLVPASFCWSMLTFLPETYFFCFNTGRAKSGSIHINQMSTNNALHWLL